MRSIPDQSLAKTNRGFFFLSLSLSFDEDIGIFCHLLFATDHKCRTSEGNDEREREKDQKKSDNGSLSHIVFFLLWIFHSWA